MASELRADKDHPGMVVKAHLEALPFWMQGLNRRPQPQMSARLCTLHLSIARACPTSVGGWCHPGWNNRCVAADAGTVEVVQLLLEFRADQSKAAIARRSPLRACLHVASPAWSWQIRTEPQEMSVRDHCAWLLVTDRWKWFMR